MNAWIILLFFLLGNSNCGCDERRNRRDDDCGCDRNRGRDRDRDRDCDDDDSRFEPRFDARPFGGRETCGCEENQ